MINEWIDRIICRYFGHQWGDWCHDPANARTDGDAVYLGETYTGVE